MTETIAPKKPRKLTAKQEAKALDARIEAAYYRRCSGIQINILDIGKVFAVGKAAHLAGADVEAAIVAFVETIRKN